MTEALNGFDSGPHQCCSLGIEPELVNEGLEAGFRVSTSIYVQGLNLGCTNAACLTC